MRKRTVGIIVGVVVIIALAVAAILLLQGGDDEEEESEAIAVSDETTEEISLLDYETDNVVLIDVSGEAGDYQVVQTARGDDENNATYAIVGWESLPVTSTLWTLPNNTADLSANSIVEEDCTDYAKFGLDESTAISVTLHFDDNESYSFRVGNVTADATYTYFTPEDDNTVYTVKTSYLSNFRNAAIDFLDKTILEAPEDETAYPIVNYLKIEREDLDYDFELDYDTNSDDEDYTGGSVATHVMVSPVSAYLSPDRSTSIVTGMFGLSADSIAVPLPTQQDMTDYGLETPLGTVTMDCDDGNCYVLYFSEPVSIVDEETEKASTYYYAFLEGNEMIYCVKESDMIWATVEPTDVTSTLVLATYVWNIGTLDVKIDDKEFNFDVTATDAKDAVVTLNGESTDAERYREFYAFLLKTTAETIDFTDEPTGDPLAEIYLDTQDGSFARTFTFYALDDFTCLITVDGQSAYTCRRSFLTTLEDNMDIYYDDDEEFAVNWQ